LGDSSVDNENYIAIIAPEHRSSIGGAYRGVGIGANATKVRIMSQKGMGVERKWKYLEHKYVGWEATKSGNQLSSKLDAELTQRSDNQ